MKSSPSLPNPADSRTIPLETRIARQAPVLWGGLGRPEVRDGVIWFDPPAPDDRPPGRGEAAAEIARHWRG